MDVNKGMSAAERTEQSVSVYGVEVSEGEYSEAESHSQTMYTSVTS